MEQLYPNILTFDVEEWFQVSNFKKYISTSEWETLESRVEIGTDFILETLRSFKIKATFFIVGWVAERHQDMVIRIDRDGHEIGIHGYMHEKITEQTPETFSKDIEKAKKIIYDITGKFVKGYRAPSYTITPRTVWALDILREHGLDYDSSLYPIRNHPVYGFPYAPCYPFKFDSGLYEFPMSTFQIREKVIPFASGAYFRIFPYLFTYAILRRFNKNNKIFTINIHPWELDPEQKVLNVDRFTKFRHYTNLSVNRKKFIRLLSQFRFTTCSEFIKNYDFPKVTLRNGIFKYL